ncbi:hypothetical protein C5E19_15725 [Pectobacterium parmentieri]|nr:hypothetical protein C5E26_16285 [Pectobacterium parmentieri]AYH28639.1 hypothetical protein C5E20_16685 [Pectobacterium parmentieri]AYH32949.1 hypothetical protein C5E19_15725 [Pectobacterium parmentieri]
MLVNVKFINSLILFVNSNRFITDPMTDVATIDRLTLNVNDASSWKVQSPAEVEIRWRTDSVTFRTTTVGNYKLAYQVP